MRAVGCGESQNLKFWKFEIWKSQNRKSWRSHLLVHGKPIVYILGLLLSTDPPPIWIDYIQYEGIPHPRLFLTFSRVQLPDKRGYSFCEEKPCQTTAYSLWYRLFLKTSRIWLHYMLWFLVLQNTICWGLFYQWQNGSALILEYACTF